MDWILAREDPEAEDTALRWARTDDWDLFSNRVNEAATTAGASITQVVNYAATTASTAFAPLVEMAGAAFGTIMDALVDDFVKQGPPRDHLGRPIKLSDPLPSINLRALDVKIPPLPTPVMSKELRHAIRRRG